VVEEPVIEKAPKSTKKRKKKTLKSLLGND